MHTVKSAVLLLCAVLASVAEEASAQPPVSVMALAGLEDGKVRQCGIRAVTGEGADQVVLEIALERSGAAAELVVRAEVPTARSSVSDVRLSPRSVVLDGIGKPLHTSAGVERRMPAARESVTAFIHELMVQGMRATVTFAKGDVALNIPGPLSASVRASYLNCAGDLYRPGE